MITPRTGMVRSGGGLSDGKLTLQPAGLAFGR